MLAMGGLALGEAVKSSGLLLSITQAIEDLVGGMELFQVMAIFCALMLVCATFISHTVSRLIGASHCLCAQQGGQARGLA
jgi:di/tricarboxylate transporter